MLNRGLLGAELRMGRTERTPAQWRLPADGEGAGEAGGRIRNRKRARWGRGVGEDEDGGRRRGSGLQGDGVFSSLFDEGTPLTTKGKLESAAWALGLSNC